MAWFELNGEARLGKCATDKCGGAPIFRLEAGGTGSNYCSGCRAKIEAICNGKCQYAHDVGMPEHSCGGECQYDLLHARG